MGNYWARSRPSLWEKVSLPRLHPLRVATDFSLPPVPGPLHHPFAALLPLTPVAPTSASAALTHSIQAFRRAVVPNPTKKTLWRDESGHQGAGPSESVAGRGWEESSWCGRRDPGRVCSAAVSLSFATPSAVCSVPPSRLLPVALFTEVSILPTSSLHSGLTPCAGVMTSAESRVQLPQRRYELRDACT